ncbi:hypothetical protein Tco_1030587 [Tanacetum coccineum]|uniref:Tf2-1-like SH3-like domain-containing protein n=1 Tax=Tanacetum coccineum TaxID=301880 RepID=A0ABQ5G6Z8_9ASTR
MITIYNGNDEVTYQMVRSHLRFKHHTNEQCNKISSLLKCLVSNFSIFGTVEEFALRKWKKHNKAYKLELPEELSSIHNTFHVSNLKKCLSDESLIIPMKELQLDDKLNFVEEPVEIMDREIKQLKRSHIPIVKVRWNSKRGPEFTWEREDEIRAKYPHLFSIITSKSN